MRNVIIFLLLLVSISCSINPGWDTPGDVENKTYFSPPTWIEGVWINVDNSYYNVKFTTNDFIVQYSNGSGASYNQSLNILGTKNLNRKEEFTGDTYKITITHLGENITIWVFTLISENEIQCDYDAIEWGERTVDSFRMIRG